MDDALYAQNLSELESMGFEDLAAINALSVSNNSLAEAIDYLFSNPKPLEVPVPKPMPFHQPLPNSFSIPKQPWVPLPQPKGMLFNNSPNPQNNNGPIVNPTNVNPFPKPPNALPPMQYQNFPVSQMPKPQNLPNPTMGNQPNFPKPPNFLNFPNPPMGKINIPNKPNFPNPPMGNISNFPNPPIGNPPNFPNGAMGKPKMQVLEREKRETNPTSSILPNKSLPAVPSISIPKIPMIFSNPSGQPKEVDTEDYKEFLRKNLMEKGFPEDCIEEIVKTCNGKEEALLILGIPTYYKTTEISKIPVKNGDFFDANLHNEIKTQLLQEGVSLEIAELLSMTCSSLEEAFANLEGMESVPSSNFYNPKFPSLPSLPHPNVANPQKYYKNNFNPPLPPQFPFPMHMNNSFSSDDDYAPMPFSHMSRNSSLQVKLNEPEASDPVAPDSTSNYFNILKDHRLTMNDDISVFAFSFFNQNISPTPQSQKRINAEIKTLSTSVPCDSTASIFAMFDSSCMHKVKFLLSGTIDTPYAHGLYLFDVLLPTNYPGAPPSVQIVTNGNGSVRFNPNLYSTGKVCLSIINTWQGRPEEMWNPASSSLLQVMLSIQSLVMDNDIIQKEPSFERIPRNSNENVGYQWEVRYGNMKYAMIEMIKKPPKGFESVVIKHFKAKAKEILETTEKWVQDTKNIRNFSSGTQNPHLHSELARKGLGNSFKELHDELKMLLHQLGT